MSTWTGCSQYYMIMMWTFSDLQDILWGPLHHSSHGRLLHLHRLPVQWHFLQITQFVWVLVVRPRRVSMLLCRAVQRHTCTHEHTVSLGVCAWLHYHCLAAVSVSVLLHMAVLRHTCTHEYTLNLGCTARLQYHCLAAVSVSVLLHRAVQRRTCTHEYTINLGVTAWLQYRCLAAVSVSVLLHRAVLRHTCTHEHTLSLGVTAWLHYHCLAAVSVCCCIGLFRDAPVHMSTP